MYRHRLLPFPIETRFTIDGKTYQVFGRRKICNEFQYFLFDVEKGQKEEYNLSMSHDSIVDKILEVIK